MTDVLKSFQFKSENNPTQMSQLFDDELLETLAKNDKNVDYLNQIDCLIRENVDDYGDIECLYIISGQIPSQHSHVIKSLLDQYGFEEGMITFQFERRHGYAFSQNQYNRFKSTVQRIISNLQKQNN